MAVAQAEFPTPLPWKPRMTVEEFYAPEMPEKFIELIEGELVEVSPPKRWHEVICRNLLVLFVNFSRVQGGLEAGSSNVGFLICRNPNTLLCPDVTLFRRRPWPREQAWGEFAPELAVEVLSPSNSQAEMVFRRHRLFDAGTEQFWLVDPDAQSIQVFFKDGRLTNYTGDEEIAGEGLLEGLSIKLSEVFMEG